MENATSSLDELVVPVGLETPQDKLIPPDDGPEAQWVAAKRPGVGCDLRPGLSPDEEPFDFPTPNSYCFSHSLPFHCALHTCNGQNIADSLSTAGTCHQLWTAW